MMKLPHVTLLIGFAIVLASCQSPRGNEAELELEVQSLRNEVTILRQVIEEQNAGQTEALLVEHLAELNGELVALKLQLKDQHPKVIAMNGEITSLEGFLAERQDN